MTTENQAPDPVQVLRGCMRDFAGVLIEASAHDPTPEFIDELIARSVAESPLGRMRDALAAIPAPEGAQADERAAFEAFCLTQPFLSKLSHVIGRDCYSDAGYDHAAVNAAWHAFRAGRAALAAQPSWICPDTGRTCTAEDCGRECQSPAEGDAGLTDEQAEAIAAFYDVSPGAVRDIYALSKPKAASDTQPKGMCRVRTASQPCDCPVATCNLWRGGLRPADAAEKLRAAHDESLDDKHQSCRSMLLEVIAELEAVLAPAPAPGPSLPAGWRVQRNENGSIGLFAPPPVDGESRRTSELFTGKLGNDQNEIVFKLLTHMLDAARSPAVVDGWQPIKTAPTGRRSLLWAPGWTAPVVDDWGKYSEYNHPKFTHWMPLPALPEPQPPVHHMGEKP